MSSNINNSSTRVWLLSGPPGIGKSSVISKVIYQLRSQGYGVGGCLTREKREGRERVGFTIADLMSGREAELASSKGVLGPRVGRYRVNIASLSEIGAGSLHSAATGSVDVIVIDEIGPMELTNPDFRKAAEECIRSGKPMVAVVHEQMKDPLIEELRNLDEKSLVEVTLHNRDGLAKTIAGEVLQRLTARGQ